MTASSDGGSGLAAPTADPAAGTVALPSVEERLRYLRVEGEGYSIA